MKTEDKKTEDVKDKQAKPKGEILKLTLTIWLEYELNGASVDAVYDNLHAFVRHGVNRGLITPDDSEADLVSWRDRVERTPPGFGTEMARLRAVEREYTNLRKSLERAGLWETVNEDLE